MESQLSCTQTAGCFQKPGKDKRVVSTGNLADLSKSGPCFTKLCQDVFSERQVNVEFFAESLIC